MTSVSRQCKDGTLHLIKIQKKYTAQIAETAEHTLAGARELFAYHKHVETVIFSSISEFVIPELGIGAHAIIQGDIVVNIDFSRHDIKNIIQYELPSTLYHEFSHIVRANTHKNSFTTLGESLVTEGIASYVEKKVFPKRIPYIEPIENEAKYWLEVRKKMNSKTYDHGEWFYGNKKLPRWIGYRLGYLLVDLFMERKKNITLAQLVRINSHSVLSPVEIRRIT